MQHCVFKNVCCHDCCLCDHGTKVPPTVFVNAQCNRATQACFFIRLSFCPSTHLSDLWYLKERFSYSIKTHLCPPPPPNAHTLSLLTMSLTHSPVGRLMLEIVVSCSDGLGWCLVSDSLMWDVSMPPPYTHPYTHPHIHPHTHTLPFNSVTPALFPV